MKETEVVRREENEQYGNEIMWKRRGTLDQERQQELSDLLQVIGKEGGEKDGNLGFGKMVEEREQILPSLHEVVSVTSRREVNGRKRVNGLHEKSQKKLSSISKVIRLNIHYPMLFEDGSQKSDLDRSFMEGMEDRSDHTTYDHFFVDNNKTFLRGLKNE